MTVSRSQRPAIGIRFGGPSARGAGKFRYRVSEADIFSDREIEELTPFAAVVAGSGPSLPGKSPTADRDLPVVYEGRGWIGGREVQVRARGRDSLHHLEVEDGTALFISAHHGQCTLAVVSCPDPEASRQAVLGPGLAVALALFGRFSLHAGVIELDGRTLVILGESGSGKSSVSAWADRRGSGRRIADDVVPVAVSDDGAIRLLPRFPQLKLRAADQWMGAAELDCRKLVSLRRDRALTEPRLNRLSTRDGFLKLSESSVGSRLFSSELRRREFDVWGRVARRNSVLEWRVPEAADRLPEIFESLTTLDA